MVSALKDWYDIYEASDELSQKIPKLRRRMHPSEERDVLRYALDGHLPLVLNLPTGTNDRQGLELEGGLWDLLIEGERGKPGRQEVEHKHDPRVSLKGITGAWVERDGVQRQLRPQGWPNSSYGAFHEGCILGVRRKDLADLAEQLKKELAEKMPTPSAPDSAKDLDKPLGESERTTLLAIIAVLAKKAGMDIETHPTTVAKQLVREFQLLGATRSYQAIERKLKLVPKAIEKLKTFSK